MKGICFIEPLFHSVIDRTKAQTRRLMMPQPDERGTRTTNVLFEDSHGKTVKSRYKKGEKVYLKEPYIDDLDMDETYYKFEKSDVEEVKQWVKGILNIDKLWKNKLFMPERAARYFIEITDVRVERLQDISPEDCILEGIIYAPVQISSIGPLKPMWSNRSLSQRYSNPKEAYAALIDSINGKGTWDENPFVFVYDFKLV